MAGRKKYSLKEAVDIFLQADSDSGSELVVSVLVVSTAIETQHAGAISDDKMLTICPHGMTSDG